MAQRQRQKVKKSKGKMRMEFKANEWNHGYAGLLFIGLGFWWGWPWLWIFGLILVIDEISQIVWFGQHGGLIHWLYIKTLYKIPIIRNINKWFDNFFGKK